MGDEGPGWRRPSRWGRPCLVACSGLDDPVPFDARRATAPSLDGRRGAAHRGSLPPAARVKVLLVTNPSSGSAAKHDKDALLEALAPLGEIETIEPSSLEDFPSEVRAAARGRDLVISAGGDGTLNCTVNALGEA